MNRREFVNAVGLGATAALTAGLTPSYAQGAGLTVRFVGMLGFVKRTDGSLLAATPGPHPMGHYGHVPFLMARAGSPAAQALGLTPHPGVIASAFDLQLDGASPDDFVFRCLDNADVRITSKDGLVAVTNEADQMAQMHLVAPGKRLRGDLRRWAHTTITLNGGRLVNSAAHPDAGKVWTFGAHKQRLTDAVNYTLGSGTFTLMEGAEVRSFTASTDNPADVWVVSAAGPGASGGDPKRLVHAQLLSQFLEDSTAAIPECAEATGRNTLGTELPCAVPSVASLRGGAAATIPPLVDLCINAYFCQNC